MKLELKHLAPYLPYGLKVQAPATVKDNERILKPSIHTLGLDNIKVILDYQATKPILRPLSDLSGGVNDKWYIETNYDLTTQIEINDFACEQIGFSDVKYSTMVILFEHHFDVFNLIDNNLAIDINKL